ncbi:MAG TPA: hypothetical protein VI072_01230 [Polyangiaceae bacterium]
MGTSKRLVIASGLMALGFCTAPSGCGDVNPPGTGGTGGNPPVGDCGCLAQTLTWGPNGGFVVSQNQSSISPCRTYKHERHFYQAPWADVSCSSEVRDCAASLAGTRLDALLLNSDVQAAFARAPVLFGRDYRPNDGTVFRVSFGGNKYVEVGAACGTFAGCNAIPAGVQSLVDLLRGLDQQELSGPACAGLYP